MHNNEKKKTAAATKILNRAYELYGELLKTYMTQQMSPDDLVCEHRAATIASMAFERFCRESQEESVAAMCKKAADKIFDNISKKHEEMIKGDLN